MGKVAVLFRDFPKKYSAQYSDGWQVRKYLFYVDFCGYETDVFDFFAKR